MAQSSQHHERNESATKTSFSSDTNAVVELHGHVMEMQVKDANINSSRHALTAAYLVYSSDSVPLDRYLGNGCNLTYLP